MDIFLEEIDSIFLVEEKADHYHSGSDNQWKFEELDAWRNAHQFVLSLYKFTGSFPKEERFALVDQMRRAAVSIPANIAEGTGKKSVKEILRFFYISRGSLEESKYHLLLARDLKYLSLKEFDELKEKINTTGRLLNALITSLERKTRNH
ncbi:MAG: four helix bundle protein [Lewinellaceae bacterium]|nr:four helix bundle protein [Lewinellaceae bacterium]